MFGFTDSFSKLTGSLGKGLSAATLDRRYQQKRLMNMNMARNRPRNAFSGLVDGTNALANSFFSGVTGLMVCYIYGVFSNQLGIECLS